MNIRKLFWMITILVLGLTLAACGGGGDSGGNNAQSDSGGGGGEVNLSQSIDYESAEIGISATVKYPEGWSAGIMDGAGMVVVGTDETIVNSLVEGGGPDKIPDNAGFMMVQPLPSEMAAMFGATGETSLVDMLKMMAESMGTDEGKIGEPSEITVNGVKVVQMELSEDTGDGLIMMAQKDDVFIFGVGGTSAGKMGDYRDKFTAIVVSVEKK